MKFIALTASAVTLFASAAFATGLTTASGQPVGSTYHAEVATAAPVATSGDVAAPAPAKKAAKHKGKHKAKKAAAPAPTPEAK